MKKENDLKKAKKRIELMEKRTALTETTLFAAFLIVLGIIISIFI